MSRAAFRELMLGFLRDANPGTLVPDLAAETDLLELGLLDSARIMELIMRLEGELGIVVGIEDLRPEPFRSIANAYDAFVAPRAHART